MYASSQNDDNTTTGPSFGSVLPPELDSKVSSEDQDKDIDYLLGVLERCRAAAEAFGEVEWAALGKRMLKDQLHDSASLYINTIDYVSDLSGIPLLDLFCGDES